MRRIGFLLLVLLGGTAASRASAADACGITASNVAGRAPLTVQFTAACASAAYTWDFGDGVRAAGQTVQHVFPPGVFRPTLTTDLGQDTSAAVRSISLKVAAPRSARYGQWVVLHAAVVPRLPVKLAGRSFGARGNLRVRVLRPAKLVATAGGVAAAPVQVEVIPTLSMRTEGAPLVGGRVRVIATLHPASAGRVVGPKLVDTRTAHVARLFARSVPSRGWASAQATLELHVVVPDLALGDHGPSVRLLERRLAELHYAVKRDGLFGSDDLEAMYAFEKIEGLPRTGAVDASVWRRLARARIPQARYAGDHVEIDKARQVLFVVRGGNVALTVATSTGATGNTPLGEWHVYRKVAGFDWVLYYPSYFLRGFAAHGYPDVPPYPASHGCARIPMWIAQTVYDAIPDGSAVYVYL